MISSEQLICSVHNNPFDSLSISIQLIQNVNLNNKDFCLSIPFMLCRVFLMEYQYANLIISKVIDAIIMKFVKNMIWILK